MINSNDGFVITEHRERTAQWAISLFNTTLIK
jgi:hypothetical protein